MERRLAAPHVDVVAIERDVERPERDLDVGELLDQRAQALGDGDAARVDADEGYLLEVGVALDDLVGDAMQGACRALPHRAGPAQTQALAQGSSFDSFPASLDRVKGVRAAVQRSARG